jgi:hypothetical protein
MCVPGEIERVASLGSEIGHLGRMDKGEATRLARFAQCRMRRVAVETMHVIQACHGKALAIAFNRDGAIDQNLEAYPLKRMNHVHGIVVAEYGEARTVDPDAAKRLHQESRRLLDRRLRCAMHVAGDNQQVDFYSIEQATRCFGDLGKDVEVRVAQMEEAVTVEGRWKARNSKLQFYAPYCKGVAAAAGIKRRQSENEAEEIQKANEQVPPPSRASAPGADPVGAAFDLASVRHPLLVPNIIRVAWHRCATNRPLHGSFF